MRVITKTNELEAFCAEIADKPFVAVDTEFMREKTYWPILCLIQAAADGFEAIIDPLADGIDLSPFLDVLKNDAIVKVFHAARQDLEIFYRIAGEIPAPLFDSQIAAMACGFGDQVGYEPLMRSLLDARIDKGSRFTDWSRRPLTPAQLEYALSDVTHLREAYPIMKSRLHDQNRDHWVTEEFEALLDPSLYFVEPETAWRRLKLRNVRAKEFKAIVKLAEWREREAQRRDTPRNRILKDDAILELARLRPQSNSELAKARSLSSGFERSASGAAIIAAIADSDAVDVAEMPREPDRIKAPADVVELLRVLLKTQSEAFDVAPKLIASSSDIEKLALDDDADIPALKGWRREIFGDVAIAIKNGACALRLENNRVKIIEL